MFSRLLFSSFLGFIFFTATGISKEGENGQNISHEILQGYAKLAHTSYQESVQKAEELQKALQTLIQTPTQENLDVARQAWIAARKPYLQTEAYRFYDGPVDGPGGPEARLNAWPMDEAFVDYIQEDPDAGLINRLSDFPEIDAEVIASLNERDGETNITLGYHVIEFLLWGQDTSDDGPGNRPIQDYQPENGKNVARRVQYLELVTNLLIEDLKSLEAAWAPDQSDNFRAKFEAGDTQEGLKKILTGIGMLSGFELPGERMMVAWETQEQEDEQSCFSDQTHKDHVYNQLGIHNVFYGEWNGEKIAPGLVALGQEAELAETIQALQEQIKKTDGLVAAIPAPFDQAIAGEDDAPGRVAIKNAADALYEQAEQIAALAGKLGLQIPITESEE